MQTTDRTVEANYFRDPRVIANPSGVPVVFLDGYDDEFTLPWQWAVCPLCNGKGTHVNPSVDCHGLTAEDFAEDYMAGAYDEPCNECGGRTTVPVIDEDRCPAELLDLYREQCRERAIDRACEAAERACGA